MYRLELDSSKWLSKRDRMVPLIGKKVHAGGMHASRT